MRLEPLAVFDPWPELPIPTRRALLGMGVAVLVGSITGGACACAMGGSPRPVGQETPTLMDDVQLDELRRLAVASPLSALLDKRMQFLTLRDRLYPDDHCLWRGVRRIAEAIVDPGCPLEDRRTMARLIACTVTKSTSSNARTLADQLPLLEMVP